jgi:BirA family transcriptional regulator, biotin operon repressor / biotin---[acetyl-CoA-carboxylase] ligase
VTSATRDLSPEAVLPQLTTRRLGRDYVFLPSCGSTSDEVAARAKNDAQEGLLVVANAQTNGRGRRGRTWHSPVGENLYCSLLLRPALPARRAAPLTLLAGVALARALATLDFAPRLKWPNDLLLDTGAGLRKAAGLLADMASEGDRVRHLVLGLGVNVNARDFPEPLEHLATSLRLVRGLPVDRGRLLAGFLNAFEPIYDDFLLGKAALDEWRRYAVLGQACWVDGNAGRIEGIASDVDDAGALLLRTASGETVAVHAGEVNWL